MLAFSGCTQGCNMREMEELTRMRYAYLWWKDKIIDSDLKRKDGLCPLTPEQNALTLKAMDIDHNIQIYIATVEIYGGERRLSRFAASYPNLGKNFGMQKGFFDGLSDTNIDVELNALHEKLWLGKNPRSFPENTRSSLCEVTNLQSPSEKYCSCTINMTHLKRFKVYGS